MKTRKILMNVLVLVSALQLFSCASSKRELIFMNNPLSRNINFPKNDSGHGEVMTLVQGSSSQNVCNPCMFQSNKKDRVPVPCGGDCLPRKIEKMRLTVFTITPAFLGAEILTLDNKIYATTDNGFGGNISYNNKYHVATLRFGVVDKSLRNQRLRMRITTANISTTGDLVKVETISDL